jgi:hypothetical protein
VRLAAGIDAARNGDDTVATDELTHAADAFAEAAHHLDSPWAAPAGWLPGVGHNVRAAEVMASAAADVSRDGATTALGARAETLTLRGGTLDLARVQALEAPLDRVAAAMDTWSPRLVDADTPWLVPPVADRLEEVTDTLAEARPDVELAADGVRLVPDMFGVDGTSRWLVAFVTPVEARGRTGFMGNFAELTATDGHVDMTRFGRASELEQGGTPADQRTLDGPEDYLARWARFDPTGTWRNITMSPDFPSVAQVMAQLYPQSGGQEVDGVIAVDPVGLAALLRLTGPITVPGVDRELTAENAAQFLLRDQYVDLPDNPERIDALESLSRATFNRLTTGSLPGPGEVADAMSGSVADGHIHMWAADEDQQALIEDVGLDGALPPAGRSDYLGVVSNNAGGNKVDLFLSRHVDYDATWDPATGRVTGTATVTLTNDAPAAGLPRYVIGSAADRPPPSGTNRTYLSVYTPWEATGVTVDGKPAALERQVERGYKAYSLFLDVPPEGGTRTVTLELDGAVPAGDHYRLVLGTQPLVTPDRFDLALDVAGEHEVTIRNRQVPGGQSVTASVPLHKDSTVYDVAVHS